MRSKPKKFRRALLVIRWPGQKVAAMLVPLKDVVYQTTIHRWSLHAAGKVARQWPPDALDQAESFDGSIDFVLEARRRPSTPVPASR